MRWEKTISMFLESLSTFAFLLESLCSLVKALKYTVVFPLIFYFFPSQRVFGTYKKKSNLANLQVNIHFSYCYNAYKLICSIYND